MPQRTKAPPPRDDCLLHRWQLFGERAGRQYVVDGLVRLDAQETLRLCLRFVSRSAIIGLVSFLEGQPKKNLYSERRPGALVTCGHRN